VAEVRASRAEATEATSPAVTRSMRTILLEVIVPRRSRARNAWSSSPPAREHSRHRSRAPGGTRPPGQPPLRHVEHRGITPQSLIVPDTRLGQRVETAVRSAVAPGQPPAYGSEGAADERVGMHRPHRQQDPCRRDVGSGLTQSGIRPVDDTSDGPVAREDVAGMEVFVQDARWSNGRRAMRREPRVARPESFQPTTLGPCVQSHEQLFCAAQGGRDASRFDRPADRERIKGMEAGKV